jgi:hypothetical protein
LIKLESISSYSVDHFNYVRRYNKLSHSHTVKLPTDNMILTWLHPSGTVGIISKTVDVSAESEQDYFDDKCYKYEDNTLTLTYWVIVIA